MARYNGWCFLFGDTYRQDLVSYGRKLLGYLEIQRQLSGVPTQFLQHTLPDGSVVRARFVGNIATIEVYAVAPVENEDIYVDPSGFVVSATYVGFSGVETPYLQQILKPSWTTLFYSDTSSTYNTFPKKSRSTYRVKYRDGVIYGGNIDWCDQDGVRINYYGPTLRYWYDLWRKPEAQYGKWVFLNGAILLDIDAYCTASEVEFDERLVIGAALVGNQLFVMQAAINAFDTLDIPTMYPDARKTWISEPYPQGDTKLRLVRYTIERNLSSTTNGDRFQVVTGSGDTLWTHTGRGWVNPFFFNNDATLCESFAMPDELRAIWFGQSPDPNTLDVTPSSSSEHVVIGIDGDTVSAEFEDLTETVSEWADVSYSVSGDTTGTLHKTTVIGVDFKPDGTRIEINFSTVFTGFNNNETPLAHYNEGIAFGSDPVVSITNVTGTEQANILCALDARFGTILAKGILNTGSRNLSLFKNGVLVKSVPLESNLLFWNEATYFYFNDNYVPYRYYGPVYKLNIVDRLNSNRIPASVSPLFLALGPGVTGIYNPGTGGDGGWFFMGPCAQNTEYIHASEVVGYCAGWVPAVDAFHVPTHFNPATSGLGFVASAFTPPSDFWGKVDNLGYRVPNSMATDDHGITLASTAYCFSVLYPTSIHRDYVMMHLTYSTGGDVPTLIQLTGVAGKTDPVASIGYTYDARYSPIWLLGKEPTL